MDKKNKLQVEEVKTEGVLVTPLAEYLDTYRTQLGDGKRKYIGVETGIKTLDEALNGLSGVIVLGGQAGGGKTTLALNIAYETAKNKVPVIFYSLEMPKKNILTKVFSKLARIDYATILLDGKKLGTQYIEQVNTEIGGTLYIKTLEKGEGKIDFETVKADIEYIKAKHNTSDVLVVVDHLQIFPLDMKAYKDQIDREQKLITGFKQVSEETGACTLLISQQNKASYNAKNATSIKGSVDIIYLADVVMLLTREADEEAEEFASYINDTKPTLTLAIKKNRYNAPKSIQAQLDGRYSDITFTS